MILELKSKYTSLVDYVFWVALILFSNPGGILQALGENSKDGGIDVTDLLYVVMVISFLVVYNRNKPNYDISFKNIRKYLIIFIIYYFVVFSFFIPIFRENPYYSPLTTIIKIRHSFIHVSLVILIYEFYLRSYPIFFKLFLFSSIIVLLLFIITVYSGIEILPVRMMDRKFIETKRLLMADYGLLPILIPMGIVVLVFKFKIKFRNLIIIGASLMYLVWLFSIFRRHLFGTIVYLIIALFLFNYLHKKALISIGRMLKIVFFTTILFFLIKLSFPTYLQSGMDAMNETIYVIQHGKSSTGKDDVRLGGGKEFMQNLIKENYVFGTGFDNRWRSEKGDDAGYEASDYPFLGSIAMYGIVGILFFLPVYIILIKALLFDINYLRKYQFNVQSFETFVLILFIVFFIYDFMKYMNWFLPISVINDPKWYVFVAMYLASRRIFYQDKYLLSRN